MVTKTIKALIKFLVYFPSISFLNLISAISYFIWNVIIITKSVVECMMMCCRCLKPGAQAVEAIN